MTGIYIYLPIVLDERPKLYGRSIRIGKSSSLSLNLLVFLRFFPNSFLVNPRFKTDSQNGRWIAPLAAGEPLIVLRNDG